ncbi:DUF6710 family protein [Sporosarcina psychrophila]|uniref:DUF6710 family protein n=1 Tax=Sporosarcina psychrophila TaxID=1476 RepID=UPI003B9F4658
MFWKSKNKKEERIINIKFENSMLMAKNIINENTNISLDDSEHPIYRAIHIFAFSIQSRLLQPIMTTVEYDIPKIDNLFYPPYHVLKENNIPLEIYEDSQNTTSVMLDFSKDVVFSIPWSPRRFIGAISNISREEWLYHELNHRAVFIEPFKIGLIENGFHSGSVGILNRKGVLPAENLKMHCLYDWIETDGVYFYKKDSRKKLCEVQSFEEAVIFEIGRLIINHTR